MLNHKIIELVESVGTRLSNEEHPQTLSGEVRKLQDLLNQIRDQNPALQCFIFLFDLLINDIFYNLIGDNGYNENFANARDAIYKQLGITLLDIGQQLSKKPESIEIYGTFCELISEYINQLNLMNKGFYKEE
jgi:hypothetical protein